MEKNTLLITEPKCAEFPDAFMNDGMHDYLKGLVPMETKLVLHEFIIKKKYFDVNFLNSRIQSFNYGLADKKNKPTANFSHQSLGNLTSYVIRQTAAQTWCLPRVFPFLFGNKVPSDDPHMSLMVLLKRICVIIFSNVVTERDLTLLEDLIFEHHTLFFYLYPPPPPQAAAAAGSQADCVDGNVDEEDVDDDLQFVHPEETDESDIENSAEVPAPQEPPLLPSAQKKKKRTK